MEKDVPVLYLKKEQCCGCAACVAACPVGAVGMEADEEGFEYPKIDEHSCICCGLCKKVCLINNL